MDQSDEGREFKIRITEQIGSAANPHQRDCAWLCRKPGLGGASPQLLAVWPVRAISIRRRIAFEHEGSSFSASRGHWFALAFSVAESEVRTLKLTNA